MPHFNSEPSLLESSIRNYLESEAKLMASVMDSENDAAKFSQWKARTAKTIEVVSYQSLPIAKDIQSKMKRGQLKIRTKACYDNSFWTSQALEDTQYCEGLASKYIPLDHAWNSHKGSFFDLTGEVALGEVSAFEEHALLIQLSAKEVLEMATQLEHSGPFALAYFYKHVLKKWDKKTIKSLKWVF